MEKYQREIVLIDQFHIARNQFLNNSLKVYFLDPVELFSKIDWRLFEEDVTVTNTVYGELFEAVVINHKKLVCYWPHLNFPDNNWFELSNHCKDAKIKTKIIYSENSSDEVHDLSTSILETWKTFVLFLMESLCEDIKMNENLQEIAILKCGDDSILLFKLEQNGIRQYSYVQSPENAFDFDFGNVQLKDNGVNYAPVFSSFELLLEKLMLDIDVNSYQTSFLDRALEKHYFNTILKNCTSKNLIESWVKNYSLN
jgi:hypothetical protein